MYYVGCKIESSADVPMEKSVAWLEARVWISTADSMRGSLVAKEACNNLQCSKFPRLLLYHIEWVKILLQ